MNPNIFPSSVYRKQDMPPEASPVNSWLVLGVIGISGMSFLISRCSKEYFLDKTIEERNSGRNI
jgi:hypothetical protein